MPACDITIINKLGLHARAAAKFVGVANRFPCQIRLGRCDSSLVDGKSIMSVMMLAAGKGTSITIETIGDDAEAAMNALRARPDIEAIFVTKAKEVVLSSSHHYRFTLLDNDYRLIGSTV